MFTMPSTKTSSPTAKGTWENPEIGVARIQVTIPAVLEIQLLIPIPLSLFSAKTILVTSFNPTGVSITSISSIDDPWIFAFMTPDSYLIPVSGLTRDKVGGLV